MRRARARSRRGGGTCRRRGRARPRPRARPSGVEALELGLRRLAAAACAGPDRASRLRRLPRPAPRPPRSRGRSGSPRSGRPRRGAAARRPTRASRPRRRPARRRGRPGTPPDRASANSAASSVTASGSDTSASASSSGSRSVTIGFASPSGSCSASSWCAGTPQYFEPGSAAFGQRLPFESIAEQRPEKSPSSPPSPPKAASASCWANSVSLTMSIFQPVSRCGEAGVHALLADRERELVVGDDHGRLLAVVVEVDLADAGRRERLGDEPRRLRGSTG